MSVENASIEDASVGEGPADDPNSQPPSEEELLAGITAFRAQLADANPKPGDSADANLVAAADDAVEASSV